MTQTFLITGAAQGLGRALAQTLAQAGHQLILLDKDLKGLNSLADEIESLCSVALFPMDLLGATPEHYQQLSEAIAENYSHLDGAFLNAVAFQGFTPLEHTDFRDWYEVLHTDLNANFHLIQVLLPHLRKAPFGKLVAVIDQEVEDHPAYYGAYGVAKAGLEQMMRSLAAEHRQEPQLSFYNAKLNAFQSNMRSKHFPSENPNDLPTSKEMSEHLADIVLNRLQAELIERL